MRERGPSPPPLGPQETLGGGVGDGIHQPSCAFDRGKQFAIFAKTLAVRGVRQDRVRMRLRICSKRSRKASQLSDRSVPSRPTL